MCCTWERASGNGSGSTGPRRVIDAVFLQHRDPALSFALDHGRLVVGLGVVVGHPALQHAVDDTQYLVFGSDGGLAVASADGQALVVPLELAVPGPCGALSTFDEDLAQSGVAALGSV